MNYLTRQMWHLRSFSESFVNAMLFVYSLDAVMTPLRRKWEGLTASDQTEVGDDGTTKPLSIRSGVREFLAFLKQHLCNVRASFIPTRPEDRERVDLATLYLVQASVADCSAQAMPYPEFVARGWAVPNITNYHPFDRLGLWCAYMNEYGMRQTSGPWDLDAVVEFARSVRRALMETFDVVDNPIRFPLLEPGGTGFCSELQVTIDASKLLDVASAIKHGHVLPWTKLRRYWAENPITNVGLFGLLVTTWAGFLSEFVGGQDRPVKEKLLENVRKLIDAASDTSLASACLGLAMDADMDPRLSPAMAGAWRLYRESDLETVRALTCAGTIFKSGIRLMDLLMWASKYGSSTFLVLNHPEERSEVLRTHLAQVTTAVVGSGEPLPLVSDTVKRLWTEWFGALMPDVNAHERYRLPMTAYAMLVSDSLQPKANWPRQLQAMCRVYNRTSSDAEVNSFLEAVPDLWTQLRLPGAATIGWQHPVAERLLCCALACPKLSPAAQLSLLQVSKTGGPLSLPDAVLVAHFGAAPPLRQLAIGLRFLPTMAKCSFTPQSAPLVHRALDALFQAAV